LEACREAALELHRALERDDRFVPLFEPELDIVVWTVRASSASEASSRATRIFEAAARKDLHLALASLPRKMAAHASPVEDWDRQEITCLRACVMKPEHGQWLPEVLARLTSAANS
jgi:hypothetical protein